MAVVALMQTFLPYASFAESAAVLDRARLGKQRVEAWMILALLTGTNEGRWESWRQHPAVRMWDGAEAELARYGLAVCREWRRRGYVDRMADRFTRLLVAGGLGGGRPEWSGLAGFHESHRSNLLRKLPAHYRRFWPDEPVGLPYVWPIHT